MEYIFFKLNLLFDCLTYPHNTCALICMFWHIQLDCEKVLSLSLASSICSLSSVFLQLLFKVVIYY